MSIVFVSHAFSSDPISHGRRVAEIARDLSMRGHLPLAPQIYLPQFIDESSERELAMRVCLGFVARSDEVWSYGDPTNGMRLEIAEAERLGIPVVRKEIA